MIGNEVVIVAGCRTPQGSFGGTLRDVPANVLGTQVVREVVARSGIDPKEVNLVAMGQVYQSSEALNIGRFCAMSADLPFSVTGLSFNAACCSSLEAINAAVREIAMGEAEVAVAAGVENMSDAPFRVTNQRWGVRRGHSEIIDQFEESTWSASTYRFGRFNMGMSAERIAREYNISRQEQDEYALRSQQLALRSIDTGAFNDEIVPVDVKTRKGTVRFAVDEAPRRDTSLEQLAKLKPSFGEGGMVTAGNASGVSDGSSALLLMSRRKADSLGVKPVARFLSMARVGVDPQLICMSPGPAGQVAVERAGLKPADIGWWEINEAFASVVLSSCKVLGIGLDNVNPAGGGIALGHPVGNSGCRTMVTMLHAMKREGVRYGCATIGGGGGIGTAAVIELCA